MNFKEWAALTQKERIYIHVANEAHTPEHEHDFLELSYVVDGQASHTLDGVPYVIGKGDYFIVDYHKSHEYTQIGDTPFSIINCMFVPQFIDETLKNCQQLGEVVNNYLIKFDFCRLKDHPTKFIYHDDDGHIGELFQKLHDEHKAKRMGYFETMRSYLIVIIIDIMRQIQAPDSIESESDMIRRTIDYVEKNFSERLSLSAITKEFNYSLAHISHTFKKETGMTFQDYVQYVRIRESCRLLINTRKRISEIADLVGYSNIQFFNEVFRRQIGMSPRDYRKVGGSGGST